ncbi:MAG: SRPBCC family protein [Nitrospinota bacterium]
MARLTVRRVIPARPEDLWKRLEGGSLAGRWVAPAQGEGNHPLMAGDIGAPWRERFLIGPFPFEVSARWAERHPPERSLCLLDGPWGLRIAEELRLEPVAAGTALALTMDYSLGKGRLGEWLDRLWVSGWVSSRLRRGLSGLEEGYKRPEEGDGPEVGAMVHLERPEDRPWGLDERRMPGPRV